MSLKNIDFLAKLKFITIATQTALCL